jgi:hypothetical protein
VFRRCSCGDQVTGKLLGARCHGLRSPRRGSWYLSVELPSSAEEQRRMRRGGLGTWSAAALEALIGPAAAACGNTAGEAWSHLNLIAAGEQRVHAWAVRACVPAEIGMLRGGR